jgi:hypothetical protein
MMFCGFVPFGVMEIAVVSTGGGGVGGVVVLLPHAPSATSETTGQSVRVVMVRRTSSSD